MIALVATALYTWVMATAYTDGKPLAAADIDSTLVQWGTCSATNEFGTVLGGQVVPAPAVTYAVALSPATYCSQVFTVLKDGRQSAPSAPVSHVEVAGADPAPPSPTQSAVVVGRETYALVWQEDGHGDFVPVGNSAKRGAQCRLLNGMGVWGAYGYGVSGSDIVMCRGSE